MNGFNSQEAISKFFLLENKLNKLSNESFVRKPYPSNKSLFNGKKPKNRRNLKIITLKTDINKTIKKSLIKPKYNPPSIQSIINNSMTQEFLSLDNSNINNNTTYIIPINTLPKMTSSIPLNKVQKRNSVISINSKKGIDNPPSNHSNNYNIINKTNNTISNSEINNEIDIKKTINLNDLYKEYTENVSILFFNKTLHIEYYTKINFI